MHTRQAKVTLLTHTQHPLQAIALGIDAWHAEQIPTSPDHWTKEELDEKFRWLLKQPHQTPLEFFSMVWVFENVSRAFQQQLTRHRLASYSIQSLRVINVGKFAEEGRYHRPDSVKYKGPYHDSMVGAQNAYNMAVELGESVEDARGLLPLNIHSPVTMCINYRVLMGLLKQRLCVAAQEEWALVAEQMRAALWAVDPILVEPLDCMCKRFKNGKGFCKTLHKEV